MTSLDSFPDVSHGSWCFKDAEGTVLGYATIDRVVAGRSCGGIRAGPFVTADEIANIARVMTLKCGFAGLAAGGAKGGVVVPVDFTAEQRAARLEAYGRAAGPLLRSGIWSHGADMGTTDRDIARIRHGAGIGPDPDRFGSSTSGYDDATSGHAAGLTVALSAEAALESLNIPLRGARICAQGVGAVGRAAIKSLAESGARIVAVSTVAGTLSSDGGLDLPALLDGLAKYGDSFTGGGAPAEALLAVPCDALLVCAGSGALDMTSADRLGARSVVCGANIPFSEQVAERLFARGVIVVPDFVAGGGGVLGSTLASAAGASPIDVDRALRRHFKPAVVQTLDAAKSMGMPTVAEAERRAMRVIEACDSAYGSDRPETLLPDRLIPPPSLAIRLLLSAERRCRSSTRLAAIGRALHGLAVSRAESVLSETFSLGETR